MNSEGNSLEDQESRGELDHYSTFDEIVSSVGTDCSHPGWPDDFGRCIHEFISKKIGDIRVLSLFSGAGGLDIGFRDAGFKIVESVEIESRFCETLEKNSGDGRYFSDSTVNCIDIRRYNPSHLGKIDFIIGGPPCQTFSAAGRRANGVMGTDDARGTLFKEYVRILDHLSPKGFLFENVYGIVGAQGGNPWKEIVDEFSGLGYKLSYRVVDAADYGVPQHRERLIIVGLKDGEFKFPKPTHGPDSIDGKGFYTAREAIKDIEYHGDVEPIPGRYEGLLEQVPPGLNYSFFTEEMGHPNPIFAWRSKFSDFLYKADPNMPVRTIKAQGGQWTGPLHWDNRHFTIDEYKRLQTFPDAYEIVGNDGAVVHQIGNSVPPQMARMFALGLATQVFGVELPFSLPLLEKDEPLHFRQRKRELSEYYRKKAKEAIDASQNVQVRNPNSQEFGADMSCDFNITITEKGSGRYNVSTAWADLTNIRVVENDSRHSYRVLIRPTKVWILPTSCISLSVESQTLEGVTLAWKILERELSRLGFKEDLVQLNGYYQYKPKISIDFETSDESSMSKVMKAVLSGTCTRRLISTSELAIEWCVDASRVTEYASCLKKLGYEVRNSNTNPQIPTETWLIPYQFPTLNEKSIQRFKKLEV